MRGLGFRSARLCLSDTGGTNVESVLEIIPMHCAILHSLFLARGIEIVHLLSVQRWHASRVNLPQSKKKKPSQLSKMQGEPDPLCRTQHVVMSKPDPLSTRGVYKVIVTPSYIPNGALHFSAQCTTRFTIISPHIHVY